MRIVFVAAAALLAATTFASAAPAVASAHAVKADSAYHLVKATKKVAAKKPAAKKHAAKKHAAKKHAAHKGHHKTCGTGKYFSKKAHKCVAA